VRKKEGIVQKKGGGAPTEQIPGTQNTVHHVQYINFNDGKRGRGEGGEGGLKRTAVERVEMLEKEGVKKGREQDQEQEHEEQKEQ
jgi:hypothetical protein